LSNGTLLGFGRGGVAERLSIY